MSTNLTLFLVILSTIDQIVNSGEDSWAVSEKDKVTFNI